MQISVAFLMFTICLHASANIGSSQGDGNSSQVDGSTSQAADSCVSKLNLSVPLLFDTTNLNCLPVWNARGYILRVSRALFLN